MSEFKKFDQDKPKFSLVPTKALKLVAEIMTMGGKKYGTFNHMKGTDWRRYWDASLRHLMNWIDNKSLDDESGKSHLAHAASSILILLELELRNIGNDDRFKEKSDDE